jgi:hypothetical protein
MGEWLGDTLDAAKFMAEKMEQARAAPGIVAREMHAYALGLADETGSVIRKMQEKGRAARSGDASASHGARRPGPTPPSNTGVTTQKKKTGRGVS